MNLLDGMKCISSPIINTLRNDIMNTIKHFLFDDNDVTEVRESKIPDEYTKLDRGILLSSINLIYKITYTKNIDLNIFSFESLKIKEKIDLLKKKGAIISFYKVESDTFQHNLEMLESYLPQILSELILTYYSSPTSNLSNLTNQLILNNPLGYDLKYGHKLYEYKIKNFLTEIALGMTSSKVWTGIPKSTNGCWVVKENGEIICYHIYNKNKFGDYLLANTKLQVSKSIGSDFGKIYFEKGNYYFKLNLKIELI